MKLNLLPPLSIYIHLPWCISKCPYCDFNSHKFSGEISKHRYLEAIKYDLFRESKRVLGRQLKTVFLGGGTPNLFSPHQMKQIITTIRNFYDISNNVVTQYIDFSDSKWTGECDKRKWANENGIVWDGISNYNSC